MKFLQQLFFTTLCLTTASFLFPAQTPQKPSLLDAIGKAVSVAARMVQLYEHCSQIADAMDNPTAATTQDAHQHVLQLQREEQQMQRYVAHLDSLPFPARLAAEGVKEIWTEDDRMMAVLQDGTVIVLGKLDREHGDAALPRAQQEQQPPLPPQEQPHAAAADQSHEERQESGDLQRQNAQLQQQLQELQAQVQCVVCMREKRDIRFNPCQHVCCCSACFRLLQQAGAPQCPICRQRITSAQTIYLS